MHRLDELHAQHDQLDSTALATGSGQLCELPVSGRIYKARVRITVHERVDL